MTTSQDLRVWLIPQRFWAVTRNMDRNQADSLMQKVMELAERHDVDGLKQFDFVVIDGNRRNIA